MDFRRIQKTVENKGETNESFSFLVCEEKTLENPND